MGPGRPRGRILVSALRGWGNHYSVLSRKVRGSDVHFGRDTDSVENEVDRDEGA